MSGTNNRRRVLKSIAAGGGAVITGTTLPEAWSKPVIDAVVLPSHAQTTDNSAAAASGVTATTTSACCLTAGTYCATPNQQSIDNGALDFSRFLEITVAVDGGIQVEITEPCNLFSGSTTISCTGGEFSVSASRSDSDVPCAAQEGGDGDIAHAPAAMQVDGTVVCGQATISGTIAFNDSVLQFSATQKYCEG